MIKNYFKVAVRNILKHKFFSAINILGLTIGMACCLFLFIYVMDELGYDKFHKDVNNLYRVGLHGKVAGQEIYTTNSSYPVAFAMADEITGVTDVLRLWPRRAGIVFKNEEKSFAEKNVFYADSNFFQFFSFKLLEGDPLTVLKEPNTVVLTQNLAEKYFGKEEALGKLITIGDNNQSYKVTGIASPAPGNSHFHYNALISFVSSKGLLYEGWTGNSLQTYVRINENTSADQVNQRLEELVAKYVGPELESGLGFSFEEFKKQGGEYGYIVYPMTDTHLFSTFDDDIEPNGDIKYVYIFSLIGVFILIIACINFMNLSTARSAGRAKEVGLRKTLGSARSQMIGQFISESVVYSFFAIVIALIACYLLLPYFNTISGKELTLDSLSTLPFLASAIALVIFVGVVAGSYPAFYLTSFKIVEVLKGKVKAGMKSKGVRSVMVVVQFSISIFLIIATVVVLQQLNFLQTKNLGMDKQNVIIIQNTRRLGSNIEPFKNIIKQSANVENASYTNNPFPGVNNTNVFRGEGSEQDHLAGSYYADYDHMDVLKFELAEGRYFSRDIASDSNAMVINEAALKEFGWESGLNHKIIDYSGNQPVSREVIGVVKNFNFESLKSEVRPLIISFTNTSRYLLIRYEGDPQAVLKSVQQLWNEYAPGDPFEYTFLDQDFDALFRSEQRLKNIFMIFAGLAIFIACLGLFALAAFTTEQRTKEIGIRKALGASVSTLTLLLSKEFTILVMISFAPAAVAAYFFTNSWLQEFAYRIHISPVVYIVSGLIAFAVAWLTVGLQAIKAAGANPIHSLRYE